MQSNTATLTLVGIAPMNHSHSHDVPKLAGESPDDYDIRTWRSKLNLNYDRTRIVIPGHGFRQCVTAGAKHSKQRIPGKGTSTWTARFMSGLMLTENPVIDTVPIADIKETKILANADGVRGSGKRVTRRFPTIPMGWRATFDVIVIDDMITQAVFREMVELAGMFVGLGQFRPENGGDNGRFKVEDMLWLDNR